MRMRRANFITLTFPGGMRRDEVDHAFYMEQEADQDRNGHALPTGGIAMATGIRFHEPIFPNEQSAEDHMRGNCEVWKHALAARYLKGREVRWMVGAWCAA